ncbi:hypothetical protein [Thiomonas sp.]
MPVFRTLRASATAAPAIAAIRKPLKARLNTVCRERGETLEEVAANEAVMAQVFLYVWQQFSSRIRAGLDREFFIQTCLQERHNLIGDAAKPARKPPLLERLRAKKAERAPA